MINVRKLTTDFLVVAAIVGLATLSLSGFHFGTPTKGTLSQNNSRARASVPDNGFVASSENLPIALRPNLSGDGSNLTQITAQNLAQVLEALNPYGPRDFGGQPGFVLPTSSILTGYLAVNAPMFTINDLWISSSSETIIPAGASDLATNAQYARSFQKIMQSTLGTSTLTTVGRQASDPNSATAMLNTLTAALSSASMQLKAVPVPAPFENFHKSFLAYIDDQRNAIGVVANGPNDPLRSLFVLNNGPAVKQRVNNDFADAMSAYKKLNLKTLLSQSTASKSTPPLGINVIDPIFQAIADNTFGVKVAHAQLDLNQAVDDCGADNSFMSQLGGLGNLGGLFGGFGLAVPVTDSAVESNTSDISQYAGDILAILVFDCQQQAETQATKADAVNTMNANELSYVQNYGDPRFITNYASYFGDAATQGATKAYQGISTQICPQFQDDINNVIYDPTAAQDNAGQLTENPAGDTINVNGDLSGGQDYNYLSDFGSSQVNGVSQGCQLQNQLDVNSYYNDFNTDGDSAWNDYYSLLTDPTNNVYGTMISAHDDINGAAIAASNGAQAESVANQGYKADVQCANSYTDDNGDIICTNEQILTPGSSISSQAETALNSQYEAVVNANDLNQLNQEVADGLTTQLQTKPAQGLYNLSFQSGNSLSSICGNLGTPSISVQGVGSFGGGTNPAQAWCNSTLGKILTDYNKYASLVQQYMKFADQITSIISSFF